MAPSIQPPMSTHPIQWVQMAGARLVPLGGRQGWDLSTATLAMPSTRAYLGVPRLGTSMGQSDLQERGYKLGPGARTEWPPWHRKSQASPTRG